MGPSAPSSPRSGLPASVQPAWARAEVLAGGGLYLRWRSRTEQCEREHVVNSSAEAELQKQRPALRAARGRLDFPDSSWSGTPVRPTRRPVRRGLPSVEGPSRDTSGKENTLLK